MNENDIVREHFETGQTAVTIISEKMYIKIAKDSIFEARSQIESKISQDPFFRTTYEPYMPSDDDGIVVKRMCDASLSAGVGPMAAVAGAIAEYAVERMIGAGSKYAIVDNGGDIAMVCDRDVRIGLYADVRGQMLSLNVLPTKNIIGICSSSASVGASVSFGKSDISTVISNNVSLADACATALGNKIKERGSMEEHMEKICEIKDVNGCLSYCNGMFGMCGDVPKITASDGNDQLITKILFS